MNTQSNNFMMEFDELVFQALQEAGMFFPETPAEVAKAEQELETNPVDLPDTLLTVPGNPEHERHCNISLSNSPFGPSNPSIQENLARAARDAGTITEEVARQMELDRQRAQEHDDG